MSKAQADQIAALQIELEETKAKLAASQGREAAMRAALGREVVDQSAEHTWCQMCRTEMRGVRPLAANHPHAWGCALATDGSGWVSPETVSGLVEALEEMLRLTPVGQHCVALCRPGVDEHHADCNERGWRDALAAFENSKRGGKR